MEQNVFCTVYLKLDIREILQRIEMLLILQFVDKSMLHYTIIRYILGFFSGLPFIQPFGVE